MMKLILLVAAVSLLLAGSAMAQDQSQKSMTNCTPRSAGAPKDKILQNGQDVEKSAILPSTGGEPGSSAAGTVQRDGKSVEMRSDCPQEPNKPKS